MVGELRRAIVTAAAAALVLTTLTVPAQAAVTCPTVTGKGTVIPFPSSGTRVDWTGCDLTGANLRGADLYAATLSYATLAGADLTGATLVGAYLKDAVLSGAVLDDADLSASSLFSTDLTGASAAGGRFAQAVMRGTIVSGAQLGQASLSRVRVTSTVGSPSSLPTGWQVRSNGSLIVGPGVRLYGILLSDVVWDGQDLTGADLTGVSFLRASLRRAALAGADITGVNFEQADLTGATGLSSTIRNSRTRWPWATCPDGISSWRHDAIDCTRPLDTKAPAVSVGVPSAFAYSNYARAAMVITENGAGIRDMRMRYRSARSGTTGWSTWTTEDWTSSDPTTFGFFVTIGLRTCAQIQVRDNAGNVSAWSAVRCTDGADHLHYGFFGYGWRLRQNASYYDMSYWETRTKGVVLESDGRRTVRQIGIRATHCPTCGSVAVYVGSVRVASFNLARSTTTARKVRLSPRLPAPVTGVVRIVVTSSRKLVRLDAIPMTRY